MSSINPPHVALIPGGGISCLSTFLRLASMLLSRNCILTLVTPQTSLSLAESNTISSFLASHPQTRHVTFDIVAPDTSSPSDADPFFAIYQAVSRSAHRVLPQLSSASPPVSSVICDFLVTKSTAAVCKELCLPFYTISVSSAKFAHFASHLPVLVSQPHKIKTTCDLAEMLGLPPLPRSSIFHPNHIFGSTVVENLLALNEAKGLLVNTFDRFEQDTLNALNSGKVLSNLPPVLAIGPLKTYEVEERDQPQCMQWLDQQPLNSVIYVSFGSRTALSSDQIIELRDGLERSGCKFLWVLKTSIVDKDEKGDVRGLLGDSFLEKTKSVGLVVTEFVDQPEILAHKAIGGFMSHCGWNSVLESAEKGVPVLAWPQFGDHGLNADSAVKAGLGKWETNWGLESKGVVKADEIAKSIRELMEDEIVRERAKIIAEEARNATNIGGTSHEAIFSVLKELGL